jgi:hypothetical protein
MFNLFHFANVIIGPAGIPDHKSTAWESTGSPAPRRTDANGPTFMRLKLPNGDTTRTISGLILSSLSSA